MAMSVARVSTDLVFKSLADPTRLGLLQQLLRDGEQSVVALTAHARVSQPAVSKHLAVLKRAGLVRDRREGRETRYRARPQGLAPVIDWMQQYASFWGDHLDRLETLLRRMNP
jgi:DNA-binding transcriptional ArsR family regulator